MQRTPITGDFWCCLLHLWFHRDIIKTGPSATAVEMKAAPTAGTSWHLRFKQSRSYSPQRELLSLCLWWERRKPFMMQAHISLSSGKVSTCLWRALPTDCSAWLGGTAQKSPCTKSIMSKNGRWWLCSSTALAVSVWWCTPTGSDSYHTEKQTKPISRLLAAEQAAASHTQTVAATLLTGSKAHGRGVGDVFVCNPF